MLGLGQLLEALSHPTKMVLWNNLIKAICILSEGIRWILGNGWSIEFLYDWWIGDSPIFELPSFRPIREAFLAQFGDKMVHYFTNDS